MGAGAVIDPKVVLRLEELVDREGGIVGCLRGLSIAVLVTQALGGDQGAGRHQGYHPVLVKGQRIRVLGIFGEIRRYVVGETPDIFLQTLLAFPSGTVDPEKPRSGGSRADGCDEGKALIHGSRD